MIQIIVRDKEKGHYDISLGGIRRFRIRGSKEESLVLNPETHLTFPSSDISISYCVTTLLKEIE